GVDASPPRRTHAPTPGNQRPQRTPRPRQTTTQQAFLTCDHRPPLAGVKLVRPRPRPDGRTGCGRSSLDPGPRGGTKPAAARKTQHNSQSPGDYQVTGSGQHALLTEKAPMGGQSARAPTCCSRSEERQIFRRSGRIGLSASTSFSVISPASGSNTPSRPIADQPVSLSAHAVPDQE